MLVLDAMPVAVLAGEVETTEIGPLPAHSLQPVSPLGIPRSGDNHCV